MVKMYLIIIVFLGIVKLLNESSLEICFTLDFLPLCQSVMNMMHVISIPYALMKVNPLSWIQKVCQFKGKTIKQNLQVKK